MPDFDQKDLSQDRRQGFFRLSCIKRDFVRVPDLLQSNGHTASDRLLNYSSIALRNPLSAGSRCRVQHHQGRPWQAWIAKCLQMPRLAFDSECATNRRSTAAVRRPKETAGTKARRFVTNANRLRMPIGTRRCTRCRARRSCSGMCCHGLRPWWLPRYREPVDPLRTG